MRFLAHLFFRRSPDVELRAGGPRYGTGWEPGSSREGRLALRWLAVCRKSWLTVSRCSPIGQEFSAVLA